VSAATAAAIDAARGTQTRSAWLDDAITAHLRQRPPPGPTPPSCSYHPDAGTVVGTGGAAQGRLICAAPGCGRVVG
jgi:hypothetical protein